MKNNNSNVTTLETWFKDSHTEKEKRELFLYLDFAMRYVHERGYCVYSFNPSQIEILNNSVKQVKFNTLLKMPADDIKYQTKLKDEDIFNSAVLQVLLYSKFPLVTNPDFLKEHFDEFTTFLPESDFRYYRGVIQDNASIYFTEFEFERVKREEEQIEKELDVNNSKSSSGNVEKKQKELKMMFSNDKINNSIYKSINGNKEAAFINVLVYPVVILVLVLVFEYMGYLIRLLGL